jgi:hypothetical protein
VSYSPTIGNGPINEKAFWVFDAATAALIFENQRLDDAGGDTQLVVIEGAPPRSSYFHPATMSPQILVGSYNNWDTIIHEYGHAFADQNNFFPFTWEDYSFSFPYEFLNSANVSGLVTGAPLKHNSEINNRLIHSLMAGTPEGMKKIDKMIFQEGFADFFSAVVQATIGVPLPPPAGQPDNSNLVAGRGNTFHDLSVEQGQPLQQPFPTPAGQTALGYSGGEDEELSVMRILWDLYDQTNATDSMSASPFNSDRILDNVNMGVDDLFRLLVVQKAQTLQDLWQQLNDLTYKANPTNFYATMANYGAIFELNNVAPEPYGLMARNPVTGSWSISTNWNSANNNPPPQFVWDVPNGWPGVPGSPYQPVGPTLQDFGLVAYDDNGLMLASTWIPNYDITEMDGTDYWTPDAATWQFIRQSTTAVNWVILGIPQKTSNTNMARDAYWSAAMRFTMQN